MKHALKTSLSFLAFTAVLLSGCAVGPDFKEPAAPQIQSFGMESTPEKTPDGLQNLMAGQNIPAQW